MINTQYIKLHTAAQLLLQNFDFDLVTGGFTEEEKAQTRIIAEEIRQAESNAMPATAELNTTGWLKRRIMLRITEIPSKMLAQHVHGKVGMWR